jgi:preprotein translocase subunit SecE
VHDQRQAERSLTVFQVLPVHFKKHNMFTYIRESFEELKHNVTLPTRAEASNLMVIVAVFSILFALATWGVDTVFSKLIQLYFNTLN